MTVPSVSVFLVDDHAMFRAGVRAELGGRLDVVGEAGDVDSAITQIRALRPAVVLLDVHLPGDGLHAIRRLHQKAPAVRLVALCGLIDAPSETELRDLGVVEYVLKGVPNRKIVAAVRRAADRSS